MSEIMMGRFISHEGRTRWVKMDLEERVRYVINAYIYFLSLPCILNFFGKEIAGTSFLHDYFLQFKGYVKWYDAYKSGQLPQPTIESWFDFFRELGYTMGFQYVLAKIGDLVGLPILAQQFIYQQFPKQFWADYVNPFYVVDWFNQQMKRDDFDLGLTTIPSFFWYPIHPFIHLDWAVIKSYIALYKTYRDIRWEEEQPEYTPPYVRNQLVKIELDGKVWDYTTIDSEGVLKYKIPKDKVKNVITLDSFGLKLDIPILPTYPLKVYVQNTDTWINANETEWVKSEPAEGWDYKLCWEDMKNQPECDYDYNDVITYIKILGKTLELKVTCYHSHYVDRVYFGDTFIVEKPYQDTYGEKTYWHGLIDMASGEILKVYYSV